MGKPLCGACIDRDIAAASFVRHIFIYGNIHPAGCQDRDDSVL